MSKLEFNVVVTMTGALVSGGNYLLLKKGVWTVGDVGGFAGFMFVAWIILAAIYVLFGEAKR